MLIADERQEFASVIGRKTKAGRLNVEAWKQSYASTLSNSGRC